MMPAVKAIHICNSHEPTLDQKLQKSMSLPTMKKMQTRFEIMKENKKHNTQYKKLGR